MIDTLYSHDTHTHPTHPFFYYYYYYRCCDCKPRCLTDHELELQTAGAQQGLVDHVHAVCHADQQDVVQRVNAVDLQRSENRTKQAGKSTTKRKKKRKRCRAKQTWQNEAKKISPCGKNLREQLVDDGIVHSCPTCDCAA